MIHEYAEKGEYTKSYSSRRTIEKALENGLLNFDQAEKLLPILLNGEINLESQVIRDLDSRIKCI